MSQPSLRRTFGTVTEPARQLDVIHETDVLVVGTAFEEDPERIFAMSAAVHG